jgi:hypothetical protein
MEVALIDTEGQRAIDVFYRTSRGEESDEANEVGLRQDLAGGRLRQGQDIDELDPKAFSLTVSANHEVVSIGTIQSKDIENYNALC